MPSMGGLEWVILLVIALLLFGGSRLAGMGKGAGKAIREFKEELRPDAGGTGPTSPVPPSAEQPGQPPVPPPGPESKPSS